MSRQAQLYWHIAAIVIGQLASNNILTLAAKAFHWDETFRDFLVAIVFAAQGVMQTAVSYIAQGYNTDGSKPGEVIVSTKQMAIPETVVTVEKETKKAGD